MNIDISKKAEEYIKKNSPDNSILIGVTMIGGGWCTSYQPSVQMGQPTHLNSFDHYKVGDINVYVLSRLKTRKDGIRVHYSKFLWMKGLSVDGIAI